ncbi:MAG TPA: hypothetical protein VHC63_16270 [Acidimicrobiales bacterium]|nr:hypothetical protein [Acidimicrobiales bacterium]
MALAATSLLLAFVSPSVGAQTDDDTPPPEVFGANATARAVSVNLDRAGLLPVPDVFNIIALDGYGEYGSSSAQSRASLLFPGNGVLLGPSLVCGTFGGSFPAQFKPILDTCLKYNYPLTVFADSFNPDSSTTGSLAMGKPTDNISADAVTARAHAAADSTTTDAVLQDLRVLGIPPFGPVAIPGTSSLKLDTSVVTVDSATSRTDQHTAKGGLVTTAKVTLSGVKLVGGLIGMKSLTSESTVTDDANGKRTADASFHATGVTVAGKAAELTSQGLKLDKPNAALNGVLKTLKINVSLLPTEETVGKPESAAKANVGGVIVSMTRDVEGLPPISVPDPTGQIPVNNVDLNGVYTLTVQLGLTGVLGSANNYGSDADLTDNGDAALGTDVSGDFSDNSSFGDSGSFSGDTGSGALVPGPTKAVGNTSQGGTTLVRSLANNFGGRLGFLYLALMFGVLALCIAPRFALPARLPGPKE